MTTPLISLTLTVEEDLPLFFGYQLDEKACYLAAFTPADRHDKAAYLEKYTKFLSDPSIHMRTIRVDNVIVGSISKFLMDGEAEITYWIDRNYWGRGIGATSLHQFLQLERTRPLYGRTAFDHYRSQKVLEKNGFVKIGTDTGFANARNEEVEEFIYRLSE